MATYDYRRELSREETLAAIGAGAVVGVAAAYLARLVLQRTPVRTEPAVVGARARRTVR